MLFRGTATSCSHKGQTETHRKQHKYTQLIIETFCFDIKWLQQNEAGQFSYFYSSELFTLPPPVVLSLKVIFQNESVKGGIFILIIYIYIYIYGTPISAAVSLSHIDFICCRAWPRIHCASYIPTQWAVCSESFSPKCHCHSLSGIPL